MKKVVTIILICVFCFPYVTINASATTTYNNFTINMDFNKSNVWFADVIYNGEIVGFGYFNYDSGKSLGSWVIEDSRIETEYQNYKLPRTLGANNGINITVYSNITNGSVQDSDTAAWSDNNYKGGNSLGWIVSESTINAGKATNLTGYVKITTASGSNTSYYTASDN